MFVKSLSLRDYRNYKEAVVQFSRGCNIIYGENAHGKTNLFLIASAISSSVIVPVSI